MPKLADESVTICEGKVVLTRRKRSSAWQARFKIGTAWRRETTKERDLKAAKLKAEEMFSEARFKLKHNMPMQTRRFNAVAKLAVERMKTEIATGQGKATYKDYIAAIDNYLVPFFGNHHIDRLDFALLSEFEQWRIDKMGKVPKASSIGNHNSALNRVMEEAVRQGFITEAQRPALRNKGKGADRRPDFTLSEYRKMVRNLREWMRKGRDGKTTEMRELLRDYVLIMANTGMRHGTESAGLKWKHVRIEKERGKYVLYMHVDGKTGPREFVARHCCVTYLKRIHARTEAIKHMTFAELLESNCDLPVFVLPDGTVTDNLRATFRKFLTDINMIKDRRSGANRTLYSLRHTYATLSLSLTNIREPFLAKQMGTSEQMIYKHYSHITARMHAQQLAGPQHGEYDDLDDDD
jgi:integrase